MKKIVTILLVITLMLPTIMQAADLNFEEQLRQLASKNAEGYVGPFATAFGTSLNSGFFHTAKPHHVLGFDISVKAAAVSIPDEGMIYDFYVGSATVSADPSWMIPNNELTVDLELLYPERESPTLFGDTEANLIQPAPTGAADALEAALLGAGKTQAEIDMLKLTPAWSNAVGQIQSGAVPLTTPSGLDLPTVGFAMAQASLGIPFGTEILLRYMPELEFEEVGKITFMGFGIKHNLDQYIPIPLFPVDISAQFAMQQFKVGDFLESNHTMWNLQASKKFGFGVSFTPYIGLGMETSSIDINYLVEGSGTILDGEEVTFELEGDNGFRTTVGFNLTLLLITLNADYSMGEYDAFTIGAGFTFR